MEEKLYKQIGDERIELTPEEVAVVRAEWANPILPIRTKLFKSTFIRRLSMNEASVLHPILEAEEPWIKLLYAATEYFIMSDALIGYLYLVLTQNFGEERADTLLEPEA